MSFSETLYSLKNPHMTFVQALKQSIMSSLTAFIFILGYMLVFQFVGYSLHSIIQNEFILAVIQGFLEFSSGAIQLLKFNHFLVYPFVCFYLSFSGLSVLMQVDNILEGIPYSFQRYFKDRLVHGLASFLLCTLIMLLLF